MAYKKLLTRLLLLSSARTPLTSRRTLTGEGQALIQFPIARNQIVSAVALVVPSDDALLIFLFQHHLVNLLLGR